MVDHHSYVHNLVAVKLKPEKNCDQLPVSLIAQLVERCIGIAEGRGSNPFQA